MIWNRIEIGETSASLFPVNSEKSVSIDIDIVETISTHRWRIWKQRVYTEVSGTITFLPEFIYNYPKGTRFRYRNKNPLDVRRKNCKPKSKFSPSLITMHGEVSTLTLNHSIQIRFDSDDVEKVDKHHWHAVRNGYHYEGRTTIDGNKVQLHRYLYKGDIPSKYMVLPKDGNWYDLRKTNLMIKPFGWRRNNGRKD